MPHWSSHGASLAPLNFQESEHMPAPLIVLTEAAESSGAVCLDGSPAAYYFSQGTGAGADNWLIHFEGGATVCIVSDHTKHIY